MRTLIFATPSTGSSEFKNNLCEKNNYDLDFHEIFNSITFNKKMNSIPPKIDIREWGNFCKQRQDLPKAEVLALYQIQRFEQSTNSIAKLFPEHLYELATDLIIKYCSKLCEVADKIFYLQRENKKEQIVSRAVRFLNGKADKNLMYTYKGDLSNDILDENFDHYKKYINIVANVFEKYPGEVVTLEKDILDTTFENRYVYEGDWQLPEELPLLK